VLDDLVRAGLADADARVVKRLGDGLMIVARDPAVALDLAVALVDGFRARTASCGWPLELRAGVHRGTCRRRDGDYFGYHVNLAARVAERAAAGDTLVTANALAGVDLSALGLRGSGTGTLQAKGVTRPVTLFSIVRHPDEAASDERRRPVRIPMLWRLPRIPRGGERSADAV
jgi:adenylate cyclase